MSNVLTHRFVSPKLDGSDATQVQPSAWNDGHKFSGGTAGDVLTRDPTDATWGARWGTPAPVVGWVPYVPAWIVAGSLTALGTHTIAASYHKVGNAVWFQILMTLGADALPGGDWAFSLPVTCAALISPGGGMLRPASGVLYPLFLSAVGFADRVTVMYLPAGLTLGAMTSTVPATLGASTLIEVRGNYTSASAAAKPADEDDPSLVNPEGVA